MTATDLDRWAADQAAYGSPDYVRGYRDGIADAVQAAKDLDVDTQVDNHYGPLWTDQDHEQVIRTMHALAPGAGLRVAVEWIGWRAAATHRRDYRRLFRAVASMLSVRQTEDFDLRRDVELARILRAMTP